MPMKHWWPLDESLPSAGHHEIDLDLVGDDDSLHFLFSLTPKQKNSSSLRACVLLREVASPDTQ